MAYTLWNAGAISGASYVNAVASTQNDYSDPLSAFVASMPQTVNITKDGDGYTKTARINLAGGGSEAGSGVSTGGWGFAKASLDIVASGFRPGETVDVIGSGPSGGDTTTATADAGGTVGTGGRLLTYSDADIAPGTKVAGGSVLLSARDVAPAMLLTFPHPLYNDPLYLGYDVSQIKTRFVRPKWPDGQTTIVGSFRPGAFKTYAETVNVGKGIENHPGVESSGGVPLNPVCFLNFNASFTTRIGRIRPSAWYQGDAVVIYRLGTSSMTVIVEGVRVKGGYQDFKGADAYVIEEGTGKFVRGGKRIPYVGHSYRVDQGEQLLITSASFGNYPDKYPPIYTPASQPQALGTANVGDDTKGFFEITTRTFYRRNDFNWARWSSGLRPGIARFKIRTY